MAFFEKLDRAADLVNGMADRLGVDTDDPTHIASFKQMVFACVGCENPDGCAKLQAANATLDQPPAFCRNTARLNAQS